MLCRHVAAADGLNVCTLRLYSAYGPWEEPKRLIPALAVEGLHGRFPPLVDPQTARDFVWVGDIVDAYLLAARAVHAEPGAVYNVGTGMQTTVGEAAEIARDVLGIEARPSWGSMPARTWDTDRWVADSTKIRDRLGWRPTRTFREGFAELASWLRERPDVFSYYSRAPWLTAWRTGPTSRWHAPRAGVPHSTRHRLRVVRRWLAALRRLIDLQAGSIWRDLAGELAAVEGLVLDVGCGAQPYRPLLGPSARYLGIDTADAKADFGYEIPDTLYFDGDSWPVDSESVNVVLCTETLEHVLEPSKLLAEAHRTLRPGEAPPDRPVRRPLALRPARLLALHAVEPAPPARDSGVHRRRRLCPRQRIHGGVLQDHRARAPVSLSAATAASGRAQRSCSRCSQSRSSSASRWPLVCLSSARAARTAWATPSRPSVRDARLRGSTLSAVRIGSELEAVRRGALRSVATRRDVLLVAKDAGGNAPPAARVHELRPRCMPARSRPSIRSSMHTAMPRTRAARRRGTQQPPMRRSSRGSRGAPRLAGCGRHRRG